ncbi:MAG: helix-turn-helix transcriptional regulator, partial [Clostridia bacterium]|nr:helix-turn-helix transcriptional regulator [Clostridia bacterium]
LMKYRDLFEGNNTFLQKGLLYSVLGELTEATEFKDAPTNEEAVLVNKALRYIEKNYNDDCTLRSASEELSYGYSYLSRTFKRLMGMSFTEYLNRFRINRAVYLLSTENKVPVSGVAQKCGFESLCSFNRNFKRITGTTPREMLAEMKESF